MKRCRRLLAAVAMSCAVLFGCAQESDREIDAIDVSGESFPTDFTLIDHTGRQRKLSEFRGKVVALSFGFTQCPDVCPTTLSAFAEAAQALGRDAERLQVLFVTIDPERDTQQLLAEYIPAFDSRFVGLYGTPEGVRQVADAYRVTYQKIPGATAGSYTIDHTAYVFLFDATGRPRLKVPHGQSAAVFVKLIRELQNSP